MENEAAQPASSSPIEPSLAGFWVRGGAVLIDGLILGLCVLLPVRGLGIPLGFAYKVIFLSRGGQTLGKMAAGVKVVTVAGAPVGIGRALVRGIAEYPGAFLLGIGYMIAASSKKRALHDYIAGTRVVYVEGVTASRKMAFAGLGILFLALALGFIAAKVDASGAIGKFQTLRQKTGEGAALGRLGSLRSALVICYADANAQWPATLDVLIPKYLPAIPKIQLENHAETAAWTPYGAEVCTGSTTEYGPGIDATKLNDTGGWGYVVDPKAACYGTVFVDCTHRDTKGRLWPQY